MSLANGSTVSSGATQKSVRTLGDEVEHEGQLSDRSRKGGIDRGIQDQQGQDLLQKSMPVLGRSIALILCLSRLLEDGLQNMVAYWASTQASTCCYCLTLGSLSRDLHLGPKTLQLLSRLEITSLTFNAVVA